MKKPFLFVFYISFACCIGFVGGMYFGGFYNQNIISKTISEYGEVQELMEWFKYIIITESVVDDLEAVTSVEGIELLREKYKRSGLTHVKLFSEHADSMKENAPNPAAIIELENKINEIAQKFKKEQP